MGWSNCTRSTACSRASARAFRDAPTSSCATARCANATPRSQSTGAVSPSRRPRRGPRRGPATGSTPCTGRASSADVSTTAATCPSPVSATTNVDGRTAVARPRTVMRFCASCPGACHRPIAGSATEVAPSSSRPMAKATTWSSADDVVAASPWSSNNRDTAACGSNESASCQPNSASAVVQRVAGVLFRRVAQAALEQLEIVSFDHRSFPRSRRRRAMMLRWISEVPP